MFNSLRDMASNAQGKMSDTYSTYMAKDDIEKVLVEATANENWNVSNSKLLQISDATFNVANVDRICQFLYLKLEAQGPQWRRILKALTAIEFIIKNGSPPAVIQFKRDLYKISGLCNFSFNESGIDRGNSVRDKVNLVIDMLSQESRLYQERAEAYEYRKKFYPGNGPTAEQAGITDAQGTFGPAFTGGVYGSNPIGGGGGMSSSSVAPPTYGAQSSGSSYNQGFGSGSVGAQQSFGSGPGLGSSQSKVYSPYGGYDGGNGQTQMGSGQMGSNSTGSGSMGLQSMGSHTNQAQAQSQQNYLSKTVNMVSSLKTTVVDSAGAVGQAMGIKSNKKGILGNPNEFLGKQGQQYPANYNPPTSISSETYSHSQHMTSSQSFTTTTQIQSGNQGFKSTAGGPWGSAKPKEQQPQQTYDKPFPAAKASTQAASKPTGAQQTSTKPEKSSKKQMRAVETESSDDEYGQEFTMPKTRKQKLGGATTQQSETAQPAQQVKAAPVQQTVDLFDLGPKPAETNSQQPAGSFAFDFMSSGNPAAAAASAQQQPVDLLDLGSSQSNQPFGAQANAPTPNVTDLLGGISSQPVAQQQQPPTSMFSGMSLGTAQPTPSVQASGFDFLSTNTAAPIQQPQQQVKAVAFDPFAPTPVVPTTQQSQAQQPAQPAPAPKYVPKNKAANDAWVKGAEFIDLVGLGTKKAAETKPASDAVYIKPAAANMGAQSQMMMGSGAFQPMAHLNEQQQQQLRLQQMQAQLQLTQANTTSGQAPTAQANTAANNPSSFNFM